MATLLFACFICLLNVVYGTPAGMITYFHLRSSCPPGWTQVAEGQLPVAVTDPKQGGISVGIPLGDKEDRVHIHKVIGSVTLDTKSISAADGSNKEGACHNTYTATGVSANSSSDLPLVQLLLCQINKADSNPVPFGSVAFFAPNTSACPANWVPFGDGNGRFLVPGWKKTGVYISGDPPLASGEKRLHSHSFSERTTFSDVSYEGIRGCCNDNLANNEEFYHVEGTSVVDASTGQGDATLPYIQLLACVSAEGTFDFKQPTGALLFNELGCPDGLNVTLEYAGRFLVGLPAKANSSGIFGSVVPLKPGAVESRGHRHDFNSSFTTTACGVELLSGCCGFGYVANQQYYVSGKLEETPVGYPYIEVPLCGTNPIPEEIDVSIF